MRNKTKFIIILLLCINIPSSCIGDITDSNKEIYCMTEENSWITIFEPSNFHDITLIANVTDSDALASVEIRYDIRSDIDGFYALSKHNIVILNLTVRYIELKLMSTFANISIEIIDHGINTSHSCEPEGLPPLAWLLFYPIVFFNLILSLLLPILVAIALVTIFVLIKKYRKKKAKLDNEIKQIDSAGE